MDDLVSYKTASSCGETDQLGETDGRASAIPDDGTVGDLADLIWGLHLSYGRLNTPLNPLVFLPLDLQYSLLRHLPLCERLRLRASCRAGRALTSLPQGWADLAASLWAERQHHAAHPTTTNYASCGEVRLANAALLGASMADACARMVAWPSRLTCELLLTYASDGEETLMPAASVAAATSADAAADIAVEVAAASFSERVAPLAALAADATFAATMAAAAAATTATTASLSSAVRVASDGRFVAFRLRRQQRTHLELGAVLGDTAFPCVGRTAPVATKTPPVAPLPFCTPSDALGVPRGWALRFSAFFETTLLTQPPAFGGVCIGLLDASSANAVDTLARHGALALPTANAIADSAAGALLGTRRGGAFLIQRHELDVPTGEEYSIVELMWSGAVGGGVSKRELSRFGGGSAVRTRPSTKATASAGKRFVDSGLRLGDTVGVCVDYTAGVVFFTLNGARLENAECEVSMLSGWRPALAASGPVALRVNFGLASSRVEASAPGPAPAAAAAQPPQPPEVLPPSAARPAVASQGRRRDAPSAPVTVVEAFRFNVLEHDEKRWSEFVSSHTMKGIFEQQHRQLAKLLDGHQQQDSDSLALRHDEEARQTEGGWPWSPCGTWQHAIEAHLEPWLRQQAAMKQANLLNRSDRSSAPLVAALATRLVQGSTHCCLPGAPRVGVRGLLPSGLRTFPSADPLAVTAVDRADLAAFAHTRGLPASTSELCAAAGLTLAHFVALPTPDLMTATRTAGLSAGLRLRLRRAVSEAWGSPLGMDWTSGWSGGDLLPPAASGRDRLHAYSTPRRRVMRYDKPVALTVALSPCLPVRSYPALKSPAVGFCACGELVTAIGECGGWVELQPPPRDEPARPATNVKYAALGAPRFWVLREGHIVGQPKELLLPASSLDNGKISGIDGGSWRPPRRLSTAHREVKLSASSSELLVFDSSSGPKYVYSPPHTIPAGGTGTLRVVVASIEGAATMQLVMFDPQGREAFWYAPEPLVLTNGLNHATLGPNTKESYIRAIITIRSGSLVLTMLEVHGHVLHGRASDASDAFSHDPANLHGQSVAPPDPYAVDTVAGLYARAPAANDTSSEATRPATTSRSNELVWVYESPRWSTTRPEGQEGRVSELLTLLRLANVPPHQLEVMLALGLSVPALFEVPQPDANRELVRAGLPVRHRERLMGALTKYRQRALDLVRTNRQRSEAVQLQQQQEQQQMQLLEDWVNSLTHAARIRDSKSRVAGQLRRAPTIAGRATAEVAMLHKARSGQSTDHASAAAAAISVPESRVAEVRVAEARMAATAHVLATAESIADECSEACDEDGVADSDDDLDADEGTVWLAAWWPETHRIVEDARPPSSSLAAALARAGMPTDEAAACALRLLANGIGARDVTAWAARGRRLLTSELGGALKRAGMSVGSRQRLLAHLAPRRRAGRAL